MQPTHSPPPPISTCSEASLTLLYTPLAFAARAAAPSLAHLMIAAAVERGAQPAPFTAAASCLTPSWQTMWQTLSLTPSPFSFLLPSLPLPQLLQKSALPVFMCCWPTP